ncbi:MAG: hypothetical protein K2Y28_00800 [Burkholderiaceae bacterium]|nr:hypothetical protein [Burkholderiaceae bacterium]
MNEGWINEDHLVLFSEEESNDRTQKYKVDKYLPGFRIIGLRGWDDFIVLSADGSMYIVPTIPFAPQYLEPFSLPTPLNLESDQRFIGKIKWYIKPIVFGGDLRAKENLTWLNHEQHQQAVTWWNDQHRALARGDGKS